MIIDLSNPEIGNMLEYWRNNPNDKSFSKELDFIIGESS